MASSPFHSDRATRIDPDRLNTILDERDEAIFGEIETEDARDRAAVGNPYDAYVPKSLRQAKEVNPYDELIPSLDDRRARQARMASIGAPEVAPDDMGRAMRLARTRGAPPLAVADNLGEFQQADHLDRMEAAAKANPALGRWLAKPENAALAKDDFETLARIERSLKPNATITATPDPSFIEEVVTQAHGAWVRGKNAIQTFLLEPMLPNTIDEDVAQGLGYASAADYEATRTAVRYAGENRRAGGIERLSEATAAQQQEIGAARGWGEAAKAITTNPRALTVTLAQSLGQGAPGLAATAAASVLGPAGTATAAGGTSLALEYGNAIATAMARDGVDDSDPASIKAFLTDPAKLSAARAYGLKRGIPVAVFDALTAGLAGRLLGGARPTVASVGVRTGGETAMQAAGGAAGELSAQVLSGDEINPTDILTEAIAEIPTGAVEVAGNYRDARTRAAARQAAKLIASADDASRVAQFTEAAGSAKLGERSPEDLEAFVSEAGEAHVYLDAEAAKVLFQSANLDPTETAASLTGNAAAWTELEATGGDLIIPAAKWAAVVARFPNAGEFSRHARFDPEALSAAELATHDIAGMVNNTESAGPDPLADSAQLVEDDVLAQLSATRVYSQSEAKRQAQLYRAMFRTLGHKLQADPFELYGDYRLKIQRDKLGGAKASGKPARQPMDLLRVLAATGGLNREAFRAQGVDPAEFTRRAGFNYLFRKQGGKTVDQLREYMQQEGYLPRDPEDGRPVVDDNDAFDLFDRALRSGAAVYATDQAEDVAEAANARHAEEEWEWQDRMAAGRDADTHYQQAGDKPRGRMLVFPNRTMRIDLLQHADRSTFLHESAHFFWEVFSDAARRDEAPQSLRDDLAAAVEWMGVDSTADLTDEHLEKWARGFEHYLAEGKAPTPALQSMFSRFRAWLLDVYRSLTELQVELSPEIRGVFDRMLAAEDEIAMARADGASPLSLGNEPKALGLTEKQWADYVALTIADQEEARAQVASRIAASQKQEAEAWRVERREEIRAEVDREVDTSPGMRAMQILAGHSDVQGEPVPAELRGLKLERAALEAAYGREWVDANLRPLGVLQDAGGVDPATVSVLLDFSSGDALVHAIVEAQQHKASIEAEADARLAERHPLPPVDLQSEAVKATHNDRRMDTIDAELGLLAQLANQAKPNRRVLRAVAAEIIAKQAIKDIQPHRYLIAERRAARKAQRAAGRGEYAKALHAKRQQALNAALYSEANLVRDTVERQVSFAHGLEGPTSRKRMGRAGVLDAFEQVLEVYSFRPRSDKERARAATLRGWFDRMLANGIEPQVPADVMRTIDESRQTHHRDLTAAKFAEVVEVLRLLDHQAKEAFELRLAGERADLDQTADEVSKAVRSGLKSRGEPPASEVLKRHWQHRGTAMYRKAGTILLRLRTLANWIDGEGRVDGAFYRYVVRPLDRAQASYLDAMQDYGNKVVGLFDEYLKGRDIARPIWIASIRQNLTKSDILAVALNTGNASNLQRMQEGRGWGDIQMMEILGHMEKADWDFTQSVWDTLETLWPQIAAQQQRLTGVEPPKVEARRVQTPFGQYAGGYYPLVYDRDSTQWRAFVNAETDSFFDPMALTALPPSGHTKERVHRARLPVKLDLGVIPGHLSNILKDLTHRETVIGIRKLMKHHDVVAAMNDTLGPEYLDMIEDKLRQVATDQVTQVARSLGPIGFLSRGIRRHVGVMAQGLSVTSALKQLIGLSNSMEVMTARHGRSAAPLLLQAYRRMFEPGTVEAITALSGEMRHRMNTSDADIRLNMNRYLSGQMAGDLKGKLANLHDGAVAHAYIAIRYVQTYAVDLPLWLAAHEGALRNGLAGDAAIAAADDAVLISQGAGGAKDTALIEGNIPGVELFTMFYSYASAFLSRQVSMGRDIGKAVDGGLPRIAAEWPLLVARGTFLFVVPVFLDDLVNQLAGSSDGPGDDEGWVEYYAKRTLAYQFYGIPGLRDFVGAKYDYRLSPAQAIPDAYNRLLVDVERKLGGDDVEAREVVRDAVNVVGYTLGLPLAGPWRHVDYLWRVLDGEEEPQSVPEFAGAVVIAKREQK